MAIFSRLRMNLNLNSQKHYRHLATSSILSSGDKTPLTSKDKTRAALTLLKSESNPEKILEICRAAALTPESHHDRRAFSIAINKLSEANYFNGISQYLEELKTRPDLQNERFHAHSIILYGQANMTEQAVRTFKEMDKHGLRHSVRAFNALLLALTIAKDYKEVKRLFIEFPKIYGIKPDLDTYNRVIKAFCESGDSSSVYSILAEMDRKSIKPNAATFGALIAGFYKEEKYEDVDKVLQMMEKYGMKSGVSMYNVRIHSLCKLRKCADAKALLDEMLSKRMKPNSVTYSHLIYGFCKDGNFEEAKKFFMIMSNCGLSPNSTVYFNMVYFMCNGGDYETALSFCKESMAKGWVPNFTTMKSLVTGLASASKVSEAKELIGLVKEKFTKNVDTWNEIEAGLPQ